MSTLDINQIARRAKDAYLELLGCSEADKNEALRAIARRLSEREAEVIGANRLDLEAAQQAIHAGEMTVAASKRLICDSKKLKNVIDGIGQVIALPDPTGRLLESTVLDEGLVLDRISCALGVVGVIFESRPEVVVQVSSLLLKAGNAGILKGGKEARHTNAVLMETIRDALEKAGSVPRDALQLLSDRRQIQELLACDDSVDLLIPRGSKELIKFIQANTKIPVLGHAEGICHVFIHRAADPEKALRVVIDSKTEYPAVCNAVETILIDQAAPDSLMANLIRALQQSNVSILGCPRIVEKFNHLEKASEEDWSTEYLDLKVSLKIVDDLKQAVRHINDYGSHHTDAIVTEDRQAAEQFCRYVDSAGVFVNASTRFSDGYRYGLGAEIGISTNKVHARGPVGLDGVVTYKYQLRGEGHIVADYNSNRRRFKWLKR
ncbi:MAG: glutamate-5-semialdehyde dehydrogenase [Deltaproteobacteria bacterium]|nr:glutamate-5-semialdehyde dehydrogenase [Deltaproteobacteria bacterium]